jgi:hypothetical protein
VSLATRLYVGSVSPRSIEWNATAEGDLADFTGVLSVTMRVVYPGGSETEWEVEIIARTATTMTVERELQEGDLPFAGTHRSTWLFATAEAVYESTQSNFRVYP